MIEFAYDEYENGEKEPLVAPAPPEITATNAHEPDRMDRLSRTWGAACATVRQLSNRYRNAWDGAVLSLHDHKGTLEVRWRDHSSRIMFEGVVMGAWEGECEHSGQHSLG